MDNKNFKIMKNITKKGLPAFSELAKIDLTPHLRKKPTFYKDSSGKLVVTDKSKHLDYVEWAKILELLYFNGAENVDFESEYFLKAENPYLKIFVTIDGKKKVFDYPLIDGNQVLSKPNQFHIHKAELRGFVKCVAYGFGLGISLWQKEETIGNEQPPIIEEPKLQTDNTMEFLLHQTKIEELKTIEDIINYYNENKELVEKNKAILKVLTLQKAKIKNVK